MMDLTKTDLAILTAVGELHTTDAAILLPRVQTITKRPTLSRQTVADTLTDLRHVRCVDEHGLTRLGTAMTWTPAAQALEA